MTNEKVDNIKVQLHRLAMMHAALLPNMSKLSYTPKSEDDVVNLESDIIALSNDIYRQLGTLSRQELTTLYSEFLRNNNRRYSEVMRGLDELVELTQREYYRYTPSRRFNNIETKSAISESFSSVIYPILASFRYRMFDFNEFKEMDVPTLLREEHELRAFAKGRHSVDRQEEIRMAIYMADIRNNKIAAMTEDERAELRRQLEVMESEYRSEYSAAAKTLGQIASACKYIAEHDESTSPTATSMPRGTSYACNSLVSMLQIKQDTANLTLTALSPQNGLLSLLNKISTHEMGEM